MTATIEAAMSISYRDEASVVILMPRQTTTANSKMSAPAPTKPNISPVTAKMKSVWCSGRKSLIVCVAPSGPLPTAPPEPTLKTWQAARGLTADDWAYLRSLPLWLDVPEHGVRIVHAGVMPGVAIDDLDVEYTYVVVIRVLDLDDAYLFGWNRGGSEGLSAA